MELVLVHGVGGVEVYQHKVGVIARLQLTLGKAQNFRRAGAHQVAQQLEGKSLFLAELGVADAESRLTAHHTGHALELVFLGVRRVVGGDGVHHTAADGVDEGLHIVGGADGRVDAVVAGVIGEPEMVGRHLAGDRCAPQLCHLDGLDGAPGGDVAHVQAGLIVLAQPAVAHRLDVLGQPIVPGADLHILGVAHHGDVPLGADGERPGHGGVILHTVAVLGDELDRSGQGLEVVDGLAVEILGDGDGLVHVAQAHLSGLLFHHGGLCCRRADRLCVGHQVHEGVAACGCGAASRFNVLFVLEARRAPVAVQVHESGQHGQSSGVQHRFVFSGQCGQVLTDGGDLSVLYIQLHRPALGVDSVDEQHKITSLSVFVWFHRPGVSALRRAKKNFSQQREKSTHQKRKHWSHSKNGCKLIFQFCTHHLGLHAPVSFSIRSFSIYFIIEAQNVSMLSVSFPCEKVCIRKPRILATLPKSPSSPPPPAPSCKKILIFVLISYHFTVH